MSQIQIALPGRNEWKTVTVISRDKRSVYVGQAGAIGDLGSLVLIRLRHDGKEFRMVARQTKIHGRYEFLSGKPAVARKAAA